MHTTRLLITLICSVLPSIGMTEPIERYFNSGAYECGTRSYVSEWSIIGNTSQNVVLQQFLRRENRTNFDGSQWQISGDQLAQSIDLSGSNGRPVYRISGLLTDFPQVVSLTRQGEPRPDCDINLQVAENPTSRYETVLRILATAEPTTEDALAVYREVPLLPPPSMLPTLSQASMQQNLNEATEPFWDRYEETIKQRAAIIDDASLLTDVANVWMSQSDNRRSRYHGRLLLDTQDIRVETAIGGGIDPTTLRVLDEPEFCRRVDSFRSNLSWEWDQYLELATGLPLEFWSEAVAEEFLSASITCDNTDTFTSVVSRRWPNILERVDGFQRLQDERDRILGIDVDLRQMVAENWLTVSRDFLNELRGSGFSQADVTDFLAPALNDRKAAALLALPIELATEAQEQSLGLDQYSSYCSERRQEVGYSYGSEFQETVFASCEDRLADLLAGAGSAAIQEHRDAMLETSGTRADLIATNGYSFEGIIPRLRGSGAFDAAITSIRDELSEAETETQALYQTALENAFAEIRTAFSEADPLSDNTPEAISMCTDFSNSRRVERLRPVVDLCSDLTQQLRNRRTEAQCDLVWTNTDAPEGLQNGLIRVPQLLEQPRAVNFRDLICNAARENAGLNILEDGGFFSTEHRLVRRFIVDGTPIEFSVRLNSPEGDSRNWTVDDGTMSSGSFDAGQITSSEDLMGCIYYPNVCYQP